MKLPSIQYLISSTANTFMRFPLSVLVTLIGTFAAFSLIEIHSNDSPFASEFIRLLFTSSLGLPLAIGIETFIDQHKPTTVWKLILRLLTIVFLASYFTYFQINIRQDPPLYLLIQFFVLNVAFHLFVAFAPFLNIDDWKSGTFSFWSYNKTLFIRILTAFLYSGVLFAGLSVALLAIDVLLNIDIDERVYARLFILIAGIFNTLFFLSGIPHTYTSTRTQDPYPVGLKMFTQYVLIPLVSIYVAILYAYMVKIIMQGTLPKGWVSYLIISFSIAGMLSFLLVHPIRKMEGNSWIKLFSKAFYVLLIPLIALLFVAILQRIRAYGITELRYIIFALAVWLAFMCLYFNISKIKNIRIIPISLCITALIVSITAFSLSKKSQLERLKTIFAQNNALDEQGHFTAFRDSIPYADFQNVESIISYFKNTHGILNLQPLFKQSLPQFFTKKAKQENETSPISAYRQQDYLLELLNMNKVKRALNNTNPVATNLEYNEIYYFQTNIDHLPIAYNIANYQFAIPFTIYEYTSNAEKTILTAEQKISLQVIPKGKINLNIYSTNTTQTVEIPTDSLTTIWLEQYKKQDDDYNIYVSSNNLFYEKKVNDSLSIKMYFKYFSFDKKQNKVINAEGILFLK